METKRINAIIQARMGSTRLPGKVLMEIEGETILGHIIHRLKAVKGVGEVIVATSVKADDDDIISFCQKIGIPCVRGSEENVLQRFGVASKLFPADIYIRATGDNPMIDVNLIEKMLLFFKEKDLTYTCYKKYPLGSGVEIFTDEALSSALKNADKSYELEHVTPFMYQRMDNRKIEYFKSKEDDTKLRMTVDTEEDFHFAQEMFKRLYKNNRFFGIDEIKEALDREPVLKTINFDVHQKELGE